MLFTQENSTALDAVVDIVARHGEASVAGRGHIVITWDDTSYTFRVCDDAESASPLPEVLLVAVVPHGVLPTASDVQYTVSRLVSADPASRIIAAFDRLGQCVWCAGYAHHVCFAGREGVCRCWCRTEAGGLAALGFASWSDESRDDAADGASPGACVGTATERD